MPEQTRRTLASRANLLRLLVSGGSIGAGVGSSRVQVSSRMGSGRATPRLWKVRGARGFCPSLEAFKCLRRAVSRSAQLQSQLRHSPHPRHSCI
eukprot:5555338-Pyramimonas_sp.AAC.1